MFFEDLGMNSLGGYNIQDLSVGLSASMSKTVTVQDIELFAQVSTDTNPVHLDDEFAKTTLFKGRIAHGMLSAGFISAMLGNQLPGPGTIYLAQNLRFKAPVRPGDTVVTTATVKELIVEKKRAVIETVCRVGDTVVIDGEATVMCTSA
jgi:3-hydroxybutyryl-CoA dehydratase